MTAITTLKSSKSMTLYFLFLFSYFSSIGQINYTQDFNGCNSANCNNWTIANGTAPSITSTTGNGYSPCINSSAKSNIWGSSTSTTLTSGNLGTSNGTLATFTFNYKCIDYTSGSATAANSCTYTIAWSPDGTTWTTIGTFQNTASATCIASPNFTFTPPNGSAVRIRITAVRNAGDFWTVFDDLSLVQLASPTLLNYSADPTLSTSFAHRRGASINPKFTIQAPSTFDAVQIEMNHASDFSGTALVSTITTGGPYNASTPYDFWTTQDLTGDRTYFVRVRVSNNGGSTYGAWSNQFWPYSYYPATVYEEEGWYFTTEEQFQLGTVNESLYNFVSIQDNSTAYPDDDFFQVNEGNFNLTVSTNGDQYLTEGSNNFSGASYNYITVGSYYLSGQRQDYHGFRFTGFPVPNGANILTSNLNVYSHNTGSEPAPNTTNPLYLELVGVDQNNANTWADNTNTATGGPRWRVRRATTIPWNITNSWSDLALMTSPDISSIVEDIVGIPGYNAGNAIAVIVDYTGGAHSSQNRHRYFSTGRRNVAYRPSIQGTFTNFYNTVRFPNVNRAIYGPDATAWDELRVTDNTVGCGTCYVEYRIHDASNDAVLAGPFLRSAGMSGAQYFDISGVGTTNIYVSTRVYRNNSPLVHDIWLTTITPSPLPVEQGTFEGRCNDNGLIELNWNSISESNTNYISVESSKDALSWETIETQNAQGNSTEIINYSATIRTQKNYNYYRLKWVDLDGKYTYSSMIYVSCDDKGLSIFPNPNNGTFVISGADVGDKYQIYNPQGQKVKEGEISSPNTIVEIKNIASGTYIIKLENINKVLHFKVISN